jgi:GNAT superfamily N-acetyltransferase
MIRDYSNHPAENSDLPVLKQIWQICFEDSQTDIDRFFSTFFGGETGILLRFGGIAAAAAYMLPITELVGQGNAISCPYIYGVGVLPQFRGQGLGAEISRAITRRCLDLGYPMSVLVPAQDELFQFYHAHVGFNEYFSVTEQAITCNDCPGADAQLTAVSPNAYLRLREELLRGFTHLRFNELACAYLNEICTASGGGLFCLNHVHGTAAAAVERTGDRVLIKELLCGPQELPALAVAILRAFGSPNGVVRSPGRSKRFGMTSIRLSGHGYFGFAFD